MFVGTSNDYWNSEGGILNQYSDEENNIEEKWRSFSGNGVRTKVMLNKFYIGMINMSHLEVRYSCVRAEENQDGSTSTTVQINAEDFETWKTQTITIQIEDSDVEINNSYLNENFYQDVIVNEHIYHVFISDYRAVLGGLVDSDGSTISSNYWWVMPTIQTYSTGSKPAVDPGTIFHEILTAAQGSIYSLPVSGGGFSGGHYDFGEYDFYRNQQYALNPGDGSDTNYFEAIANGFDCEITDYINRFRQSRLYGQPRVWEPYGNCMWHLMGGNWTALHRMYQPNDIIHHMALLPRWKAKASDPNTFNLVNGVYYPEVLPSNEFTGRLITGTANELLQVLRPWQYSNIDESDYDSEEDLPPYNPDEPEEDGPTPIPTENKYSGDSTDNSFTRTFSIKGVQYYALNENLLSNFIQRLWSQPKSFYDAIQIAGKQTNSIFDYVESLRYYPIAWDFSSQNTEPVHFGTGAVLLESDSQTAVQLSTANSQITSYIIGGFNLSESKYHWRNNFLDYAPYTKISIYLPYVGTVELDSATIASNGPISSATITIQICLDITTGCLTYYVKNGSDVVLAQKTTKIAIDLPLSGNDSVQQSAAILRAQFNTTKQVLGSALAPVAAIGQGNPVGALQSIGNLYSSVGSAYLENSLAKKQVPVEIQSQGGVASNIFRVQTPYLTIHRQKYSNPSNYGHTVGFLAEETYTIKNIDGFTTCRNVDVSRISKAIEKEKAQIKKILESGFYA